MLGRDPSEATAATGGGFGESRQPETKGETIAGGGQGMDRRAVVRTLGILGDIADDTGVEL